MPNFPICSHQHNESPKKIREAVAVLSIPNLLNAKRMVQYVYVMFAEVNER